MLRSMRPVTFFIRGGTHASAISSATAKPLAVLCGLALMLSLVMGSAVGLLGCGSSPPALAPAPANKPMESAKNQKMTEVSDTEVAQLVDALSARYGEGERERIVRGIEQVRARWRQGDGDAAAFRTFVETAFVPRGETLEATFRRFEFALERVGGYYTSMVRDLRRGVDLDMGPILDLDRRLATMAPGAHLSEDAYASKVAFVALLNFSLTSLEERLKGGGAWARRQWAEARLADAFALRVPSEVNRAVTAATSAASSYISAYNIYMHHLIAADGGADSSADGVNRPFPAGLRLISHWGLRDELKARYADPDGLIKQRMIQAVMERIVRQEIPAVVINNPLVDWDPRQNQVRVSDVDDIAADAVPATAVRKADNAAEDNDRYRHWLEVFRAVRQADPYSPTNPTLIDRRFNVGREIPETEVEALLRAVLEAPVSAEVAALVAKRLGRPLEPFDMWYVGFRPRGAYTEDKLDRLTRARYPNADAYAADMPRMLRELGFSDASAQFLADNIVVEPSRGAGHAFGPGRRDDRAHLRTRVGADGMDYKGYNIAVHEMGHNVEQVFSVVNIDHTLLQGVPNTAFTEALAFVFQGRDLELLGLTETRPEDAYWRALDVFWSTREIAGVALVDMQVWRWLYANPDATPSQMREAVVDIANTVWNRYYADLLGADDVPILAIYSHMISGAMYTPDYPLGHLIAFQIEAHFHDYQGAFGSEFERICRLGRLTPDAWMRQAVGAPLSAQPLLEATEAAMRAVGAQ